MSEQKEEKNTYGIISIGIPGEILFNPFITRMEREMFGHIRILSSSSKGCFMSNRNLGNRVDVSPQTASNGIANLKKYKYIKIYYSRKHIGTKELTRHIYVDSTYHERYEMLIPLWNEIYFRNNATRKQGEKEFLKEITEKCRKSENRKNLKAPIEKYIGALRKTLKNNETDEEIYDENSFLKKRKIPFSDEKGDSLQTPKQQRKRKSKNRLQTQSKNKYRRKDIRSKQSANKIPPYVIDLITQWNSYPNTTTHRINLDEPSKTIKTIHKYFIQLRIGKMTGLSSSWIKRAKIPNKKYSMDELKTGIERLSKYSENSYWPETKNPWVKNLPGLLYNKKSQNSLFMQVMVSPPKKLSEQKKIKHQAHIDTFTKANIWDNKKPDPHELDRVLEPIIGFWNYLKQWVGPDGEHQGAASRLLYRLYFSNYIQFLESSGIWLDDVWMLGITRWPFKKYIEDIWDDLYHSGYAGTNINPVKLLESYISENK